MKNDTNKQRPGTRNDEINTKKSGGTKNGGTKQGSKTETGTTRAGSEGKRGAAKR